MRNQFSVFTLFLFLILHANSIILHAQEEQIDAPTSQSDEAYQAILQFYQYDEDYPLHFAVVDSIDSETYKRYKIVFTGINNSRVVGYLAIPKAGQPPYPCVLQMHGMTVSKDDFWEEEYHYGELVTQELLSSGYAVLALDMPYHGDRLYENDFESTLVTLFRKGYGYRIRDMVVQSVIEYRRALDYLERRKDIDMNRIGAIGYSLGSVVTFILTGVDERIKSTVICSTAYIKPQPFFPPEEYLSGIAPVTFIPHYRKIPLLILAAENDDFNCSIAEAKHLFNLIGSDEKELIFFDSKHQLPPDHAPIAAKWLIKYLAN